ncbi:Response regulator receiver protein [Frankia canadensis]|uniref:Response regulator receiver protein n=1 Tax=Frankia canadensis TaxID=1836972 RepID=A0A2I2KJS6_9ACTN|nr:response regulator transcription factor [Frankia canadensis]SNQ45906.1 Response regulator receiver protein [Frankia canadensis]SOU53196.1 Response regulator receiver protein [Frankia canadensis]
MVISVAVVDPLPMFCQGVVAALAGSGHRVDVPDDVLAWSHRRDRSLILLTLDVEPAWSILRRLRAETPRHVVLALIEGDQPLQGAKAVQAGAQSVLPRAMNAAMLRRTIDATSDGLCVLPASVMTLLAATDVTSGHIASGHVSDMVGPRLPPPTQLSWLRQLAAGSTVSRLAGQIGYSERAMFRQLRGLYQQMGVSGRTEAILRAQEFGWLTPDGDG